jgi:hypothetical protein
MRGRDRRPSPKLSAPHNRRVLTHDQREKLSDETDERRVFFKTAFVFGVSQTDLIPGVEPAPAAAR